MDSPVGINVALRTAMRSGDFVFPWIASRERNTSYIKLSKSDNPAKPARRVELARTASLGSQAWIQMSLRRISTTCFLDWHTGHLAISPFKMTI